MQAFQNVSLPRLGFARRKLAKVNFPVPLSSLWQRGRMGYGEASTWIWTESCVTSAKLLNLSEPPFPYLQNCRGCFQLTCWAVLGLIQDTHVVPSIPAMDGSLLSRAQSAIILF